MIWSVKHAVVYYKVDLFTSRNTMNQLCVCVCGPHGNEYNIFGVTVCSLADRYPKDGSRTFFRTKNFFVYYTYSRTLYV